MTARHRSVVPAREHRSWPARRLRVGLAVTGAVMAGAWTAPPIASAATSPTAAYEAALDPVTVNGVTGTGAAWVTVDGDQALVQIQVQGLTDRAPHAQHLYIGGSGGCPRDAMTHDGRSSLTAADGQSSYGDVGLSLTLTGDTGPAAALSIDDVPTAGSYTYVRTVPVDAEVRDALAAGSAVLVVHGIGGDTTGGDNDDLPAEVTNPALCGRFEPMQMTGVPVGAAETGGGSTAGQWSSGPAGPGPATTPAGLLVVGLTAGAWLSASRRIRRWLLHSHR